MNAKKVPCLARRGRRRGPAACRGLALAELALALPLFFLMFFAVLEFGQMFLVSHLLSNAAREAGRVAALPGTTDRECNAAVARVLYFHGDLVTATVCPSTDTAESGTPITVTVRVPVEHVSWLLLRWCHGELVGRAVMIKE